VLSLSKREELSLNISVFVAKMRLPGLDQDELNETGGKAIGLSAVVISVNQLGIGSLFGS